MVVYSSLDVITNIFILIKVTCNFFKNIIAFWVKYSNHQNTGHLNNGLLKIWYSNGPKGARFVDLGNVNITQVEKFIWQYHGCCSTLIEICMLNCVSLLNAERFHFFSCYYVSLMSKDTTFR